MEFRDKFIEFMSMNDRNIFEFINDNINYLPVLMLDQEDYHNFFKIYKEYQEQKKLFK